MVTFSPRSCWGWELLVQVVEGVVEGMGMLWVIRYPDAKPYPTLRTKVVASESESSNSRLDTLSRMFGAAGEVDRRSR